MKLTINEIIRRVRQALCDHEWPTTRGWYGEPHHSTAPCLKCGKVYES